MTAHSINDVSYTHLEIKDRFIAGNVIEKAERIEGWMEDNRESERMPEVKQAWEALKEAEPQRIAFEDLDFNFGDRWIPTGVYAAYMSHLFDTDGKIAYSASMEMCIRDRNCTGCCERIQKTRRSTNGIWMP